MRILKTLFCGVLLSSVALPAVAAESLIAESTIKAATVYTNRAKVERKASVKVPQGAHEIVFENLPASLLPDSIRAEGSSAANVVIGAIAHKRVISSDLTSERERELNNQLETLNDQRSLINANMQALRQQKEFLQSIGEQAKLRTDEEIAKLNLQSGEWQGAAEVIYTSLSDIYTKEVQLNIKNRELQEQINKVHQELNQLRTGQRSTYKVTIPVEADSAATLNLTLSYQVPNATWRPLYDARLSTENDSNLTLVQYGAVRQNTGEDWSDVKLTLSTAQPHRGASLPAIYPQWIDLWKDAPRGRGIMQKLGSPAMDGFAGSANMELMEQSDMALASAPAEKKAAFAAAQINTGGFVSEYIIPGPADVLSDGSDTKLMVGKFETESSLEIHIQPQNSRDAFLVADTKLKGEAPILPGQVNLFRDGAYVGQSSIPMLRPEEEHDFFFGVDDQVTAERKVLENEKKDANVVLRDNVLSKHFLTKIQNLHKQDVTIVVKETIPVAKNEKIDVKLDNKITTKGYTEDTDDIKGLLSWTFKLTPQEQKDIHLGWSVEWPKDHHLSGL